MRIADFGMRPEPCKVQGFGPESTAVQGFDHKSTMVQGCHALYHMVRGHAPHVVHGGIQQGELNEKLLQVIQMFACSPHP